MRKLIDLLYGRGAAKFESSESFQLLFKSWTFFGFTTMQPYRLGHLLHMCLCWYCLALCPVAFYMGYIQTLRTAPISIQLNLLQATVNVVGLQLKCIVILILKTHLRSATPIFAHLDERCHSAESREEIKNCVVYCTRLFAIVGFMYHFYATLLYLQALVLHTYPLNTWLPFTDYIHHPTIKYFLHFIIEVFHISFQLSLQATNDVFPPIYIRNLRTHLNLLTKRVSRLGKNTEFTDEQNYDELVDCIVTHQELLEAKNIVASVCSITVFIQFIVVAIANCISLLNFFVFADRLEQLSTFSYYISVLIQIMPTCYQASMLEEDSAKLPNAIFHCNWLGMDKRCRKLIIYFMQCAQEDITFVAFKLFKINMTTNLSIAKFAFTLYTFMNNMGFGQNMKDLLE
ncbi:odorant receptor 42b-like [Zeugodacus cucurbitae]|uniref:odorant receptor 42b-like n=1 Tax=Zeugodacus cucurbitae TaxID=28588 RepID=UPI0023D91CD3|nr:odorant receptor 42b-like [Zeugodacus cucurbitae]